MPFRKEPLNPQELALLRRWIDQGANWPSDQPPPAATPRLAPRWPRVPEQPVHFTNPIDRFVAAHLSAQGKIFPSRSGPGLPEASPSGSVGAPALSPGSRELPLGGERRENGTASQNAAGGFGPLRSALDELLERPPAQRRRSPLHGEREPISEWLRKALQENLSYDRLVQALLNPAAEDDPRVFWSGSTGGARSAPARAGPCRRRRTAPTSSWGSI